MVLDGLEKHVEKVGRAGRKSDKINFIRYADDFVVTAISKDVLDNKVKPAIVSFLAERGLELSLEKTRIVHIKDGFDFLGFNLRKYNGKMLIKPAKKNVLYFLEKIRALIKTNRTSSTDILIRQLNTRIRGWANFYRHVVSKRTFNYVDHQIFESIAKWTARRHPNKFSEWLRRKYFRSEKLRNWIFSTKVKSKTGEIIHLDLFRASSIPIQRHVKIRASANPFEPAERSYFVQRKNRHKINSRDVGVEKRELPRF